MHQRGNYLPGASLLVLLGSWSTHKNLPAARCVARAGGIVRPIYKDTVDTGVALPILLQADSEDVLAVERKIMVDCKTSTRPEGECFAGSIILDIKFRTIVRLDTGPDIGIPNCQAADLSCRCHVFFEQHRRYG